MDFLDGIYLMAISLAGAIGRALTRGLPNSVRVRLEATAPPSLEPGWVWLHAVSVGELLLAAGILSRLREGGFRVHITTGTQAGLKLLIERLPIWDGGSGQLSGSGFPLDDPCGLKSFFESPPSTFIALETEIWPNLYRTLESKKIPICIVNGRLTKRSMNSWLRPWLHRAASRLSLVAARDSESARRFLELGAPNVVPGGNLKAELPEPPSLHEGWKLLQNSWRDVPTIVAGNTVEGEESLIFAAWKRAKEKYPGLRLIIAPRQPKRFDTVAILLDNEGIQYVRASSGLLNNIAQQRDSISPPLAPDAEQWTDTDVLLLDTMGELASVYGIGRVALIGGGWCWHGGHNPLEPLKWGVPTLIGPGYTNFEDIVTPLLDAGSLTLTETQDIADNITHMLDQSGHDGKMSEPVRLPESLCGCLQRTWEYLEPYLVRR